MKTESNYALVEYDSGNKCIAKRIDEYEWESILWKLKKGTWIKFNDSIRYPETYLTDTKPITIKNEWITKEDMVEEMFTEFL